MCIYICDIVQRYHYLLLLDIWLCISWTFMNGKKWTTPAHQIYIDAQEMMLHILYANEAWDNLTTVLYHLSRNIKRKKRRTIYILPNSDDPIHE